MAIASTRFVDFRSRNISPSLAELTALVNTAMKVEDIGYYPPTWQALQESISYAMSVVRSHAPEQGQILLATQMLTSAMGGLIEWLSINFAAGEWDDELEFSRASTATYWGPSRTLLTAAVDEARIQHDPVTGRALGVLIESEATNSLINSSNPSLFTHVGADISLEQGEGLEWVITSTSAGTGSGYLYQNEGQNPTDARTCSVWFKQGTSRYGIFTVQSSSGLYVPDISKYTTVVSDFINESLSLHDNSNSFSLGAESYIGAGYCKIVLRGRNLTNWTDSRFCIAPSDIHVEHAYRATSAGGSIIYIGGQVDLGSGATSYIPTIDSPVTRAADNAVIDLSDVLNPDEGTLRITAQVPEGEVVASLGGMQVISDSNEKKTYGMTYSDYTGVPTVTLGNGIHSKLEYLPEAQP